MKAILVGNSKRLLTAKFYKLIDAFDVVIRMNGGKPAEWNKENIGSKTTHWSVSTTDASTYKSWKIPGAVPWHLNRRINYPCIGYSNPIDNYRELIQTLGFDRPSTGLITAHYATNVEKLDLCLIGFDFYETGSWYCPERTQAPHDWTLERKYMIHLGVSIYEH